MAHGGSAPVGLVPLARRLDRSNPTSAKNLNEHIEAVTRIIMDGLRIDG
jgi:hypothetical protein